MDLGLTGRRALVTGGSRGIGRECALSLAREGATVCISYIRNESAAERTRQDLLALGVSAYSVRRLIHGPVNDASADGVCFLNMTGRTLGRLGHVNELAERVAKGLRWVQKIGPRIRIPGLVL